MNLLILADPEARRGGGGVTVVDPSAFEISEIKKKYLFYKCSKVDITAVRVRCA